jgi:hypothetical protein
MAKKNKKNKNSLELQIAFFFHFDPSYFISAKHFFFGFKLNDLNYFEITILSSANHLVTLKAT